MPIRIIAVLFFLLAASVARAAGLDAASSQAWTELETGVAAVKSGTDDEAALRRVGAAAQGLTADPALALKARTLAAASEEALRVRKAPDREAYGAAVKALLAAYADLRGEADRGRAVTATAGLVPTLPAIKEGDGAAVGERLDRIFNERPRGEAGEVGAGNGTAAGAGSGSASARFTQFNYPPETRPLDRSRIGALPSDEPSSQPDMDSPKSELARLQVAEAVLSSLPSMPLVETMAAKPLADVRASRALLEAGLASRDWLAKGSAELDASNAAAREARVRELRGLGFSPADARAQAARELAAPGEVRAELDRVLSLPAAERAAALAALQGKLDSVFGASAAAKGEQELRDRMMAAATPEEAAAAALALQEFGRSEREYLQARGAWAQFVTASRAKLPLAPDGAEFPAESLGMEAEAAGPVTRTSRSGSPGIEYRGKDGLRRFVSFDGQVSGLELGAGDKRVFVVTDKRDGKLIITTYDDKGAKIDAERYEPQADGRVAMTTDSAPWPRALGRMGPGGRFVADEYQNEDGSRRVSAGEALPGAWSLFDPGGKASGWTFDPSGLAAEKDPAALAAKAAAASKWLSGHVRQKNADEAKIYLGSVTTLIEEFTARGGRANSSLFLGPDGQITLTEWMPGGGVSQLVAKMEDAVSGRKMRGLKVYARHAASASAETPFRPVLQYFGRNISESFSSRVESNTERWYWWLTGPKVEEIPIVRASSRKVDGQGRVSWVENSVQELPPETIFEASGIVGQTGHAIATVGKGAADLTASAAAVTLAHSPAYYALVKATGGDASYAYDDMMARAKVNFFDNAVSRELGENLIGDRYVEGKKELGLDTKVAIQNVGQEMRSLGHDTAGGVLQGGVNFSNNVVTFVGGAGALGWVSKLGNSGRIATGVFGVTMSGVGGYHLGSAIDETVHAAYDYDASDPASRDRWYTAVTGMSEQALNAPMLFGIASKSLRGPAGAAPGKATMPEWVPASVRNADLKLGGLIARMPAGGWFMRELALAAPEKASKDAPKAVVPEPIEPKAAATETKAPATETKAPATETKAAATEPVAAEPEPLAAKQTASQDPAASIRQGYGKAGEPYAQAYEIAAKELGADAHGIAGRSSFAQGRARLESWPKEIVVNGKSEPFTFEDALMMDKVPTSLSPENLARLPARTRALVSLKQSMGKLPSDVDIVSPVTDEARLLTMRKSIYERTGVLVEFVQPEVPIVAAPKPGPARAPPSEPPVDLASNREMLRAASKAHKRPSMADPPPEWTAGNADRPRVQLVREVSGEGSSGIVFEGRLNGQRVAVKTFSDPLSGDSWNGRFDYFKNEVELYRAMESALPKGSVPKMHGEVNVGGNPSFATELVQGKDLMNLTAAEARLIPPEAVRQAAAAVEALAAKNLGGMDSPQPMMLTRAQVINGVPRKAGDIIFMDAGALSSNRTTWQTPAELAQQVAIAREMAFQSRPGEELLTIEALYRAIGPARLQAVKASANAASEAAAAQPAAR